jgi:hypothetical protein
MMAPTLLRAMRVAEHCGMGLEHALRDVGLWAGYEYVYGPLGCRRADSRTQLGVLATAASGGVTLSPKDADPCPPRDPFVSDAEIERARLAAWIEAMSGARPKGA